MWEYLNFIKLGDMLTKWNVLFNRSNSLQKSEAKHTNDTAEKSKFLKKIKFLNFKKLIS